jgi:hypothetical protein
MTTSFKFNVEEVKCNGTMGGAALILNQENESKVKAFMMTHFMMTDRQIILQELQDSGILEGSNWLVGSRCNSIQTLYCRMTSGLLSYGLNKFAGTGTYKAQRENAEMWINAQVHMMSAKELINVLEKALMDAATADYYYTYEKMWA